MNYLFFDTETTGLPKNYNASVSDVNNWPRLVQIAWIVTDETGKELHKAQHIIKPEGFEIPGAASNIHGITTDKALKDGEDLKQIMEEFSTLILNANVICAHNISFDRKIVGAEFFRIDVMHQLSARRSICTMKESTRYCNLPGKYGPKWPNLTELHTKLFDKGFEGAHDAMADIQATVDCFWELVKRDVIKL